MAAIEEMKQRIAETDPVFYNELAQTQLPAGWKPDSAQFGAVINALPDSPCLACFNPTPTKRCRACKLAMYCNAVCQRRDWIRHKTLCAAMKTIKPALKEAQYMGHLNE
jgi:hypothetical protein